MVLQDMKSNHGNALRARTLFEEKENLEKVIVVYLADENAEEYAYDIEGMQFGKITKERFLYTSNIEKAKLQSRGKAVSGESRGDVPVFELDIDDTNRYKSRNAQFWLNCNENIDELEAGNRELIYIPIANYKVVNEVGTGQEESVTLDSINRDIQGVRRIQHEVHGADDTFEFPLVIGVRRKDCTKLTKTRWKSWANYKKDFAKSYLVKHKKKVAESEKAMAFSENKYSMENYGKLASLLDNKKFHRVVRREITDKNHVWNNLLDDMDLMANANEPQFQTISHLVNFMRREDEEWTEKNIPSTFEADEFDNNCKEICDKYPLLVNIASEVYGWQEMEKDNFGKNMTDYILMCDLV